MNYQRTLQSVNKTICGDYSSLTTEETFQLNVALATASIISIFGASLIITTYLRFPEFNKKYHNYIVFWIALSDLGLAYQVDYWSFITDQ